MDLDGCGNIKQFRLYNSSRVCELVPYLNNDLCNLFKGWNRPPEELEEAKDNVLRKLRKKLKLLDQIGTEKAVRAKFAENIGGGLYSLRVPVKGDKNLRILYCLGRSKEIIILLCAFNEKDKKRGGKTSYDDNNLIAQNRKKELVL